MGVSSSLSDCSIQWNTARAPDDARKLIRGSGMAQWSRPTKFLKSMANTGPWGGTVLDVHDCAAAPGSRAHPIGHVEAQGECAVGEGSLRFSPSVRPDFERTRPQAWETPAGAVNALLYSANTPLIDNLAIWAAFPSAIRHLDQWEESTCEAPSIRYSTFPQGRQVFDLHLNNLAVWRNPRYLGKIRVRTPLGCHWPG